jgi:hypothetical protein
LITEVFVLCSSTTEASYADPDLESLLKENNLPSIEVEIQATGRNERIVCEGIATGSGVCGHSDTIDGYSSDMYYFGKLNATRWLM